MRFTLHAKWNHPAIHFSTVRVCEENEPQIRVKALYRAVAIPHYLPENR